MNRQKGGKIVAVTERQREGEPARGVNRDETERQKERVKVKQWNGVRAGERE